VLKHAPVVAVTPAGEEIALAQVVEPPPVQATRAAMPQYLPETASPLYLFGLLGLLSLGAGLALSAIRKRAV
jgi:LPXTG-motif cell wall-anchored protein